MNRIFTFCIFLSSLSIALSSCNEQSAKVKSASAFDQAGAAVGVQQPGIDNLYIEGELFEAYYRDNASPGLGNDKAVFQFLWPRGIHYLTMGLYHANNHVYKSKGPEKQPLLVLKNFNTGSDVSFTDYIIFGDLQVGVDRSSPPPVDNLGKIHQALKPQPDEKVVVFKPYISNKHLAYEIYVFPKSDVFDKNGKIISGFQFLPLRLITNADPSPPATALN